MITAIKKILLTWLTLPTLFMSTSASIAYSWL